MAASGPQNSRWGLERCLPLGFWALPSNLLNKFFDPSTLSMRKVDDGEKRKEQDLVFSVKLQFK